MIAAAMCLGLGTAAAQELRIGLADDVDSLDPDQERTTVARLVLSSLCDRLFDIDADSNIIGQLATDWSYSEDNTALTIHLREGVTFHDGTPFNAEAVRYNLDRSANLPTSLKKEDVRPVTDVVVEDEYTVTIHLDAPFSPFIAKLASSAGTMISPTQAEALGEDFGREPVCTGPFRFVSWVAQDRIVLERYEDYWDPDRIHFDRLVFIPIPDGTVRLANLQAGDIDLLDRLDTSDVAQVEQDPNLAVTSVASLGYQSLIFNLERDTPIATDPRVREALEYAIDRNAIVQVAFSGQATAGNQFQPPGNPNYNPALPIPERDVEKARALLDEAGHDRVSFELLTHNNPVNVQVAEMIQAMAAEAGFDIQLKVVEFATSLDLTDAGEFEVWGPIGPGGRIDPDGVSYMSLHSEGNRNVGGYSNPEMDRLMTEARAETDPARAAALYQEAMAVLQESRAVIYLFHPRFIYAHRADLEGFVAYPDGLIRIQDMRLE